MTAKPPAVPTAPEGPLVLVIDDVEDNRAMYAEYFRFVGFRVAEARNGREGIDQAVKLQPNVVVMDLSLPVMDGWEATRRLKADARTRDIPVIALTGHALEAHGAQAREAGCDAFLTKPCLPDDLLTQVRATLAAKAEAAKTRQR
jgi:CheY-like chemotaxis protein